MSRDRERREPGTCAPAVVMPATGSGDPFWWLREQAPFLRRFILAQALSPPRSRQPWGRRPPGVAPPRRPPKTPEPGDT